MSGLGFPHLLILLVVVLLLFGRGKISAIMGEVAEGFKAFKKGMADDDSKVADTKPAPMKTIDQAPPPRVETTTSDVSNKAV